MPRTTQVHSAWTRAVDEWIAKRDAREAVPGLEAGGGSRPGAWFLRETHGETSGTGSEGDFGFFPNNSKSLWLKSVKVFTNPATGEAKQRKPSRAHVRTWKTAVAAELPWRNSGFFFLTLRPRLERFFLHALDGAQALGPLSTGGDVPGLLDERTSVLSY